MIDTNKWKTIWAFSNIQIPSLIELEAILKRQICSNGEHIMFFQQDALEGQKNYWRRFTNLTHTYIHYMYIWSPFKSLLSLHSTTNTHVVEIFERHGLTDIFICSWIQEWEITSSSLKSGSAIKN